MAFRILREIKNNYKKCKTRQQFCPVSVHNPLNPRRTGHQENILNLSWHSSWAQRLSSYLFIFYQSPRQGHASSRSNIHSGFRSWLEKYIWMLGGKSWLNLKLLQRRADDIFLSSVRRDLFWWDFCKAALWMSEQIFVWHCRFDLPCVEHSVQQAVMERPSLHIK